jgi:hypothetical protein
MFPVSQSPVKLTVPEGGGGAIVDEEATTADAADVALDEPYAFAPVTRTRSVLPASTDVSA